MPDDSEGRHRAHADAVLTSPTPLALLCRGLKSALTSEVLPALITHLPADRERLGLREVQMAGRLELTLREYRDLEAGQLDLSYDLYERIVGLRGWPR